MKKKLLITVSMLLIAILAFALSACTLNLNKASTITINISRAEGAQDCAIEATSSYGELTQNGDVITITTSALKEFIVTLSSDGFMSSTVNVTIDAIKDGKETYDVTFGDKIPSTIELSLNGAYENLAVTSDSNLLIIDLKDTLLTLTRTDKYANPTVTITAKGYETMALSFDKLSSISIVKLVKTGNIQIIYNTKRYSNVDITLTDDFHNIYSPLNIGGNLYFELPKYDGNYNRGYDFEAFKGDKTYGTIVNYGPNTYSNSNTVNVSKEVYDIFNSYINQSAFAIDINGKFVDYVSADFYKNDGVTTYYIQFDSTARSILLFQNNYSQYAQISVENIDSVEFNKLTFSDAIIYQQLINKVDNMPINNFVYKYSKQIDFEYVNYEIPSENGVITLPTPSDDMQNTTYVFDYQGDTYSEYVYSNNTPSASESNYSTFKDGTITIKNTVSPRIDLQLQVYDGDVLLQGGDSTLQNMTYTDGYYVASNWSIASKIVSVSYKNENNSHQQKSSSNYIDLSQLVRVGEKTYRYMKPVYINNNDYYCVAFTLDGQPISDNNLTESMSKLSNSKISSGNDYIAIETSLDEVSFTLTYESKRYQINLNPRDFDNNGKTIVYELNPPKH